MIAIVALVAVTQLPALSSARNPTRLTQCLNNCRRIGYATLLYQAENHDAYPYGNRCLGSGTNIGSVVDPYAWPRQLLRYRGGDFPTNTQPPVYCCPSENGTAPNWVFPVHYQANRDLLSDLDSLGTPITSAMVRKPEILWMFIEKNPRSACSIRSDALDMVREFWNSPPGSPWSRRHNGGMTATAADGHLEWLRMPPYQPGQPAPCDLLELGICVNDYPPSPCTFQAKVNRVKLYSGYCPSVYPPR